MTQLNQIAEKAKRLTKTQAAILNNLANGRRWDSGRPAGMSAAGGWDRSYLSCAQAGWLNYKTGEITDAGREAASKARAKGVGE